MRQEGWKFLPNHLLPPLLLNAAVGFTLFFAYSTTSTALTPSLPHHSLLIPFISGSIAGAAQSLISAPLDNARLLLLRRQRLLRTYTRSSHSRLARHHALSVSKPFSGWWDLLRDSIFHPPSAIPPSPSPSTITTTLTPSARRKQSLHRARDWAKRGWSLWGLSLTKDAIAFGAFFTIFESGRRVARMAGLSYDGISEADYYDSSTEEGEDDFAWDDESISTRPKRSKASLGIQSALILVSGAMAGWIFSVAARPFERVRGAIYEGRATWAERDGRMKVEEVLRGSNLKDGGEQKLRKRTTRTKGGRVRVVGRTFAIARKRRLRRLATQRTEQAVQHRKHASVKKLARKARLALLPTAVREPLPSAVQLLRTATDKYGAFTYLFAPLPVLQSLSRHPTSRTNIATLPRRPPPGPTRLSARRVVGEGKSGKVPVWKRAGKMLQYVPPYAIGLLVYAVVGGDLT
ncbi:hypothetical protein P7C70_g588, partial [Phenoliferia sp. Uapishka_3]